MKIKTGNIVIFDLLCVGQHNPKYLFRLNESITSQKMLLLNLPTALLKKKNMFRQF